jgi:hypothetical protein
MTMKRRTNQIIAVEIEFADHEGRFTRDLPRVLRPMLLPGGINTAHNVRRYLDTIREGYFDHVELRARVMYRWRSNRHLKRWLSRGGNFIRTDFRKSPVRLTRFNLPIEGISGTY